MFGRATVYLQFTVLPFFCIYCGQVYWIGEIKTFRYDLNNHLTTNLRNKLEDDLDNIYHSAVDFVESKTDLTILPEKCPYSLSQLLADDYFLGG
jgi:hypothetical protein